MLVDQLSDYPQSVAEGLDGTLWIYTRSGIYVKQADGKRVEQAAGRFGLPRQIQTAAFMACTSGVFACIDQTLLWKGNDKEQFQPVLGVPQRSTLVLSNPDSSGSIWASAQPEDAGLAPEIGKHYLYPQPRCSGSLEKQRGFPRQGGSDSSTSKGPTEEKSFGRVGLPPS